MPGLSLSKLRFRISLSGFLLFGLVPATLVAESSWQAPLAVQSLLLDIERAGRSVFAVGERGHVLKSIDGRDWQQLPVPSDVLLTAVDFHNASHGCVVGHDAVIMCTRDGGGDWQLVYRQPELESPLLDIVFLDESEVLAVGAYSLYLRSTDGGRSWEPEKFRLQADSNDNKATAQEANNELADSYDLHLNAIVHTSGDELYIAAEAGRLYRSTDRGRYWQTLPSPYAGSWFGLLPLDDRLLAYGLRGHAYLGSQAGQHWERIETGTDAHLTSGMHLQNGGTLLAGHGGILLYAVQGTDFRPWIYPGRPDFTAIGLDSKDSIQLTGENGITTIPLSEFAARWSRSDGQIP